MVNDVIYRFCSSCPKCGQTPSNPRYVSEVTDEQFAMACDGCSYGSAVLVPPREEHLEFHCDCGHCFWTRTADYVAKEDEAADVPSSDT